VKQQITSIYFPQLEAYPPITVHAKFSPSSILIVRNIALYHILVMSKLLINLVPNISKWYTHWIVYNILSVASKAAIAYTIWAQMGFLHVISHCDSNDSLIDWDSINLPRKLAWTRLCFLAKMGICSMIPLGLQEWTIQMIFMMRSIKTLTMRTFSNKTLILK